MAKKRPNRKSTNRKAPRPAISWLKLPALPRGVARAILFVLIFANTAMAYLAVTSAASYYVRFVYFCASNSCSTARTSSTVNTYGSQVQSWYTGKVGKSFPRATTYKIVGQHTASYYYTHGTNGYPSGTGYSTERTYYNVYNELVARGWINSYSKVVVVLGFRSMANCGVGGGNFALSDPQKGCASIQQSVLAHELGHTFLKSSSADHTTNSDYNFMHAPLACNGKTLSYCTMYSSQRTTISSRPWFNN